MYKARCSLYSCVFAKCGAIQNIASDIALVQSTLNNIAQRLEIFMHKSSQLTNKPLDKHKCQFQ